MILKLNILKYGTDMKEALQGLKLIDLTRVRSGPSAVRQFADWGADVIKIETPVFKSLKSIILESSFIFILNLCSKKLP